MSISIQNNSENINWKVVLSIFVLLCFVSNNVHTLISSFDETHILLTDIPVEDQNEEENNDSNEPDTEKEKEKKSFDFLTSNQCDLQRFPNSYTSIFLWSLEAKDLIGQPPDLA